ncbi:MAG: hypothetical protein WC679_00420 [Bacteroidales bacterium]|jgi:hypothetical protein
MKTYQEYINEKKDANGVEQIYVTKAPSKNALNKAIGGWNAKDLNDKDLIDANKQAATANYLLRYSSKQPKWAQEFKNRQVLGQCGSKDLLNVIEAEIKKRNIQVQFDIEIN